MRTWPAPGQHLHLAAVAETSGPAHASMTDGISIRGVLPCCGVSRVAEPAVGCSVRAGMSLRAGLVRTGGGGDAQPAQRAARRRAKIGLQRTHPVPGRYHLPPKAVSVLDSFGVVKRDSMPIGLTGVRHRAKLIWRHSHKAATGRFQSAIGQFLLIRSRRPCQLFPQTVRHRSEKKPAPPPTHPQDVRPQMRLSAMPDATVHVLLKSRSTCQTCVTRHQ